LLLPKLQHYCHVSNFRFLCLSVHLSVPRAIIRSSLRFITAAGHCLQHLEATEQLLSAATYNEIYKTGLNSPYRHNKKAQLSLTNPRDAKACQKLLQFDVLTTLSLTILAYLYSFSCCCVWNLRNPEKFTENSNWWSSRSSKVIDLGVNGKPICDFLL